MGTALVTVFGGTGFLGRRVVARLRQHGVSVRIASRHPGGDPEAVAADIHDDRSVAAALAGASGVVNAVSLYVEHGRETFQAVHVEAARRLAAAASRAGVERLVQLSGIGADPASPSRYIRKRGNGEQAVRAVFPGAVIVRPAVMFGPDDAFLGTILDLLRRLPVYPMFGRGQTRLQPVLVDDVAEAIARVMTQEGPPPGRIECVGPRVYTYEELLRTIAEAAGIRRLLMPLPFTAWHGLARLAGLLPHPPLTRSQVELMQIDTVASPGAIGLGDLGIAASGMEATLGQIAGRR